MSIYSSDAPGLLDEQIGALVVQPVRLASVAAQVSSVVGTQSSTFRIPILSADADAAWTPEGGEITPDDADFDEIVVACKKLAGLTVISRELAEDSSPSAQQLVGASIAESIARRLDAAFFGDTIANGPSGLGSVVGVSEVDTGGVLLDLDPFAEAISVAEVEGAVLTSFVMHPADLLELHKVKKLTGSNEPLLTVDPTQAARRSVFGVPLVASAAVTPGTVWGIPAAKVFLVLREGTRLDVDASAFFQRDSIAVRCTMRCGFGFAHPAAIVKLADLGS